MWNIIYNKYLTYLNRSASAEANLIYELSENFINYIHTEYSNKLLFRRPLDAYVIQDEFLRIYPSIPYEIALKCFDFINMYIFLCPFNIIGHSYITYGGKVLVNDIYLNNVMMDNDEYFECLSSLNFFEHIKKSPDSFNILFYDSFLDNYIGINNLLMGYDSSYNGFPTNLDNDLRYSEIKPILDITYRDTWQNTVNKVYRFLDILDTALKEDCYRNHIYFQPDSLITMEDYEEYAKMNYHLVDSIQGQAYEVSSYINVLPEHRAKATECVGNYILSVLSSMFPDIAPSPPDDDPTLKQYGGTVFIYSLKDILYDARTLHSKSGSSYSNMLAPNLLEMLINNIGPYTINGKLFVESVQWEDFIEIVSNIITYYFIMILAHSLSRYAKFDDEYIINRMISYIHNTLFKEAIANGRIHY